MPQEAELKGPPAPEKVFELPKEKPILAIGDVNVDLISPVLERRKTRTVLRDIEIHGGGCAANFAYACARLGAPSSLIGKVTGDVFGEYLRARLAKGGVDTGGLIVLEPGAGARTGVTIALVKGEEKSFITYFGGTAELSLEDIDVTKIYARAVHLPSFFIMEKLQDDYAKLIDAIKEATGATISMDPGWEEGGEEKLGQLKKALKRTDVVFANEEEAKRILEIEEKEVVTAERLAGELAKLGPRVAVVKTGHHGNVASDGYGVVKNPSLKVDVVDTTGAGDVFDAAFLVDYLRHRNVMRAGKVASVAGALSTTGMGWSKYPTMDMITRFLRGA